MRYVSLVLFLAAGFMSLSTGASYAQNCGDQLFKLLPDDGEANDYFGFSVAIDGTTAIAGAHLHDDNGTDSGSAYLFDTTTGREIFKLLPEDGASFNFFGGSVAISGATAIIGANLDDDNGFRSGSAYLFDSATGEQITKLLPRDGGEGDMFGLSVAISGTTAVVGAVFDDENGTNSGSVYLFDTVTGREIAKLLPDDGAEGDLFGIRVAIASATAVAGAYWDDDNGIDSGSAYLFDTTTGRQIAKLLPDDGATHDRFGRSVAISASTVIVGAYRDDDNGSNSGSAYLFDISDPANPIQTAKLLPDDGAAGDEFGISVAINGSTAILGARHDDDSAPNAGAAYLFDISDTANPEQTAKLLPADGAARDEFGFSVAISGTTAIVGAYLDDDRGRDSGSAYLFDLAGCGNCVRNPVWICDGDTDGDGQVNPVDSGLVQAAFGSIDEQDLCQYDMDCDGQINPVDSGIVQSLFGTCDAPRGVCP